MADGVLAPGATQGECPRNGEEAEPSAGAACNLYVSEPEPEDPGQRETRLIAAVSYQDAADWGAAPDAQAARTWELAPSRGNLSAVSSRVSPNGRYLAFMSDRSLTGYDNVDASPEADGARDEEVFLYDASTGRLVCASCNPTGEPPHGVFDHQGSAREAGLLVDHPGIWANRWLAGSLPGWTFNGFYDPSAHYQPRYLSNGGRLFFDSADALVPQVAASTREEIVNGRPTQVGVENVYEYEPAGDGSCAGEPGCVSLLSSGTSTAESAFLDASENGGNAFFLTSAALVSADTNKADDIYDARVCSEASPCLPSPSASTQECESSGTCRPGSTSTASQVTVPASATSSGPGNVLAPAPHPKTLPKPTSLTRAQKLAKALKACKAHRRKRTRIACERHARRLYGPKPKAKRAHKTDKKARRALAYRGRG